MRWGATPRRIATFSSVSVLAMAVAVVPMSATAAGRTGMAPPEGAVPDLAALGWTPVFDEEFDEGALDRSVWDVTRGPGVSGPGWNTPDVLRIVADPQQSGDGVLELRTYSVDTNGSAPGGLAHRTGEMRSGPPTGTGMAATYGYIEAKVTLHSAHQTRSAFWTLSADARHSAPFRDPAAAGPEIDIFEIGHPADGDEDQDGNCDGHPVPCERIVNGGKHWDGFDEDHKRDRWYRYMPAGFSAQGTHTWGLLWTPAGYRLYVDGQQYYQSTEAVTYSPEYLIFSLHQGGALGGRTPAEGYGELGAATNGLMAIDYVKVWQRPISEVPDRTVAANSPVSMPFSVTDYFFADPAKPEPELVRVKATSGDTAVVPAGNVTVTGNPTNPTTATNLDGTTADPDGSLTGGGFESGTTGWTTTAGTAGTWTTRKHSGNSSLRLTQTGGRVEQTITGLLPDTAYTIGGYYNLELDWVDTNDNGHIDWTDTNGDGRCDRGEGEVVNDGLASFDWGVVDVDASIAGNQGLRETRSRNGETERCQWWTGHEDDWTARSLRFTTGPNTTQVTLFVDNWAYRDPNANDSNLSFDSVWTRPTVPADRTVTVRPNDNRTGPAPITLTAWVDSDYDGVQDGGERVLGTERFTVTFTGGSSFTNGDFESGPQRANWELWDGIPGRGADVVVDDPFTLDRVLELGGPALEPDQGERASGTAFQRVTNLAPNTPYTLRFMAKGTGLGFAFNGALTDPCVPVAKCQLTSSDWVPGRLDFTTDATGSGSVILLDWSPNDGPSLVDDVTLTPNTGDPSQPPLASPPLTALGEQRIPMSAPAAVNVTAANTTVVSVTSDNQELLPDRNLRATPGGQHKALSLTPVPGRTGKATVTVTYSVSGAAPQTKRLPVVVFDDHVVNAGFDAGNHPWEGASIVTSGQRSGAGALLLPDNGTEVKQTVTGLPYNLTYELAGWTRGDGAVSVTVRTVVEDDDDQPVSFTATWPAGTTWGENTVRFTTKHCMSCPATGTLFTHEDTRRPTMARGARVEILLRDANPEDGRAVHVDDLALLNVPAIWPVRDVSIPQNRTGFDTHGGLYFGIGHLPANAVLDPARVRISSSNSTVVPVANIEIIRPEAAFADLWRIRVRATTGTQPTGRSDVTVSITDRRTGLSTSEVFAVTVNAGTNFNNGDFERGDPGGWESAGFFNNWQIRDKQTWNWLTFRCALPATGNPPGPPCDPPGTPLIGPNDHDQVLRISSGVVGYRVTGLSAGTRYVIQAQALGDGSTLEARHHDYSGCTDADPTDPTKPDETTPCVKSWGTSLGSVPINSRLWNATPELLITPTVADNPATPWINESDVWIFVWDADNSEEVLPSGWQCAQYVPGQTCVDDITLRHG